MAFQKGQSGNPGGRGKAGKIVADAIRVALYSDDKRPLFAMTKKLVEMAESGDIQAIKEVADRIDGKPVQAHAGADGEGPIEGTIKLIWEKPE